ncbi:21616_t:CDS:2 [Dentiscutata erythropus]|uniref:21616_t:CDS:1 n=1 Tax=Dentiscutata erythropus TaxID=1348616 RepID=A0A9N8Z4N9_9GLOM|nr:21616_t:CDS:2 [Dentiscutata erythropus]
MNYLTNKYYSNETLSTTYRQPVYGVATTKKITNIGYHNSYDVHFPNTNNFIDRYLDTHITEQLPIGLITDTTMLPTRNKDLTVKFHHQIVQQIQEDIWKPSRASFTNIHLDTKPYP